MTEGVYIHGLSPESLREACCDVLMCGSIYSQLVEFCQPISDSFLNQRGLVFQAMTDALQKYLQYYRGCVLAIPKDKTLAEVNFIIQPLMRQIL